MKKKNLRKRMKKASKKIAAWENALLYPTPEMIAAGQKAAQEQADKIRALDQLSDTPINIHHTQQPMHAAWLAMLSYAYAPTPPE